MLYFIYLITKHHATLACNKFYIPTTATLLSISIFLFPPHSLLPPVSFSFSSIFISFSIMSSLPLLTCKNFLSLLSYRLWSSHWPCGFLLLLTSFLSYILLYYSSYIISKISQASSIKIHLRVTTLIVSLF